MHIPTTLFPFSVFCFVLSAFAASNQAQMPDTAAGKRLAELLRCVNEEDSEQRTEFLTNGFTDEDETAQRITIAQQVHLQMAPLSLHKVIESEPLRIVAHCRSREGDILKFELNVAADGENLITDIGMQPVTDRSKTSLPDGTLPLFDEDHKSAMDARGIWLAEGYGYVFEITEDAIHVYNEVGNLGWKQGFDEDLLVRIGNEKGKPDSEKLQSITFHPLEPGYNLVQLPSVPEACLRETEWTPPRLFDAFVEIFNTHYPFFEVRNVNWKERADRIRPTITADTTEMELFDAMANMIKDLDDGHVGLIATINNKSRRARTGGEDTYSLLRAAFEKKKSQSTFETYVQEWEERLQKSILETTLSGAGKVVAGGQIIWGRAHDKIGYLCINGMGGYAIGDTDTQVKELHRSLNQILNELADTDALIIDISFNGGGSDLFSLEIAAHFADKKRIGFSKWPSHYEKYRQDRSVTPYVNPQGEPVNYDKPVFLVTNDVTASAAEIFAMCMRALPNVTTVGLPTEGALSDILSKNLPNGWSLGLSNEIYVDHEGICFEGPGVPPEIRMDIFDTKDISKIGHAESIDRIVKLALEKINPSER